MKKLVGRIKDQIAKADVISFDIFDTLLVRNVAHPKDVFTITQAIHNHSGSFHVTQDFSPLRIQAERNVFVRVQAYTYTLDDIYDELERITSLSHELCEELKKIERHAEQLVLRRRNIGYELYTYARRQRKRIILTSDMYLSANDVKKALAHNGYSRYDQIIVSSHDKITKADGSVYHYLFHMYPAKKILHIGDNLESDIKAAEAFGIHTGYIPKQIDTLTTPKVRQIIAEGVSDGSRVVDIQKNIIAALVARRSEDVEEGSEEFLGYSIGAALVGFVQWLQMNAKADKCTHLYFLARDGALARAAYRAWYGGSPEEIASSYIIASRRIYNFAALSTPLDAADKRFLTSAIWSNTRVSDVFERFGISAEKIAPFAQKVKLKLHDCVTTEAKRRKVQSLAVLAQDIFMEAAEKERALLLDYLDSVGLTHEARPAVIDIGWHGTLQLSLHKILKKTVQGYYFGRNANTCLGQVKMKSYTDQVTLGRADLFDTPDYVTIVEQLFTNPDEASMIGIKKTKEGRYEAETSPVVYARQKRDNETIRAIQTGALAFVADYRDVVQNLPPIIQNLDREAALSLLMSVVYAPAERTAQIFGTLHHFDGYGTRGNRLQYVGYSRRGFGYTVTKKQLQDEYVGAYWKQGFIKNLTTHRRKI